MKTEEAVQALGLEQARFRFIEMQCEGFLSSSRLEFPRHYEASDLKIMARADLLLKEGLPPGVLKSRLAEMLAEPTSWDDAGFGTASAHATAPVRTIAVTSGKGGVGKSNVSLNLGVELVRLGLRVAVIDADLGVANAHLLAGLKNGLTLKDVVGGKCSLDDVIATVPNGPDVVPGSSGILELANLSAPRRQMLLSELRKIESRYDVVLIDTAAGVSSAVLDFVVSSDFTLVVTTCESTAITDAYALIKLSHERNQRCRIGVVANRVRTASEGESTLERISTCARRFLGKSTLELGWVWEDTNVRRAVNDRKPFLLGYPKTRASASIRKLARTLQDKHITLPCPQSKKGGSGLFAGIRASAKTGIGE